MFSGERGELADFERVLQRAEIREPAADHELRLTVLAAALAHFLEAVVHQVQLEIIVVDAGGIETKDAHFPEQKAHAAGGAKVAAVLRHHIAHMSDRAGRIVGGGFDQQCDAVRRIAFVKHFMVVRRIATRSAFDRRFDFVLGHVHGTRVLDHAPQGRIASRVRPARLDRHVDVLGDARELLRHAVPACKHRVFANFEDSTHGGILAVRWPFGGPSARSHYADRGDGVPERRWSIMVTITRSAPPLSRHRR